MFDPMAVPEPTAKQQSILPMPMSNEWRASQTPRKRNQDICLPLNARDATVALTRPQGNADR